MKGPLSLKWAIFLCLLLYSVLMILSLHYQEGHLKLEAMHQSKPIEAPQSEMVDPVQSHKDVSRTPRSFKYNVFKELASCRLHPIDPFNKEFMKYFPKVPPLNCSVDQPSLVNCSSFGILTINSSAMEENNVSHCVYIEILRGSDNDNDVNFEDAKVFIGSVQVNSEVVQVHCYREGKVVYDNLFYILKKQHTGKSSAEAVNVIVWLLDSLSKANSFRQMKKTHEVLRTKLKSHVFQYHIKSGHNTTPNLSAMLSGKRTFIYVERGTLFNVELLPCMSVDCKKDFIDDFPMSWKNFTRAGYSIALAEDYTSLSVFNYLSKGFKFPPVNYHMRAFWKAWERLKLNGTIANASKAYCVLDTPMYEKIFQWGEEVIRLNRNGSLFGIFFSSFAHDNASRIQLADASLSDTLNSLYDDGVFNNSIVIVMGDHGYRYGDYRQTMKGRQEDFMPLFSISLPSWLKVRYPNLDEALEWNTNRVTSWYDVYETLMDIVTKNFNQKGHHKEMKKGMSLFKKIPTRRSCADAGVPLAYCPCFQEVQISNSSKIIKKAALLVMEKVNKLLEKSYSVCAKLEFSYVKDAFVRAGANGATPNPKKVADLRVVVRATPSNGLYEGILVYNATNKQHKVEGPIDRVDSYGDQGKCTENRVLQLYCYCRNLMKKGHQED